MGTAIPMPDAATDKFLDDARSQAVASLKGKVPDSMLAPPPLAQPRVTNSITNSVGKNLADAQPLPPPEPSADAQPVVEDAPPPAPAPTAVPVDENTAWNAVKGSTKELGGEVGNGLMRAAAATARTLGFAAAGANTLLQGDDKAAGRNDKIFDFIKNHVDTAYDYWKQDPGNTNSTAQFLGSTAEGIAPIMLGAAGPAVMAANATIEKGKQSVDAGDNTKTAVALALINGLTTTGQLGVGFKNPNIAKQIAKWVGAGAAIDEAGKGAEILVRHILNDESYKEAIKKVDPLNPSELGVNAIIQTIFGILHSPKGQKLVKGADPHGDAPKPGATPVTPDLSAEDPNTPPPPPPGPTFAGGGKTSEGAPVSPVDTTSPKGAKQRYAAPGEDLSATPPPIPDKPSAEPSADLRAQIADMKDPATARKAVYLSAENVKNLGPDGIKHLAGDGIVTNNFDKAGGVLISPTHSERSKATALRKANGDDMQRTLGQLTGAGEGKSPDQTAVVQGHTPEGAVATETTVTTADVPAAVAAVHNEGKTPVVTTPEAAVARRADLVEKENTAAPGPEAVPVPKEGTSEPKEGDRRLVRVAGEDVPVVIAGSPDGNKVPVRMIDSEGRVAKDVRHVPLELFKKGADNGAPIRKPADIEEQPSPEAAPQVDGSYKPGSPHYEHDLEAQRKAQENPSPARKAALDKFNESQKALREKMGSDGVVPDLETHPLEQAAKLYDKENTPEPGKKYAGSVAEHAARVAGLARAVDAHLKTAKDIPDDVRTHAQEAANRAKNLDLKTPEQIAKNQGVSHLSADARAKDLKQAIRNIMDPTNAVIPKKLEIKADALKAKIVKERAAAAEPAKPTMAEKIKTKQAEKAAEPAKVKSAIRDVEDITKPKKLNAGENAKIGNAARRYLEVGIDDAAAAHDNLERVVHDIYGPDRTAEATHIMELARDQRESQEEARRPRRMSDDISEEDFRGKHVDGEEHEDDVNELRMSDADFQNTPMGKLHEKLQGTGFWKQFGETRDNGKFLSTHKVLTHLVNVSKDNPVMQTILSKLLQHTPNIPIRPVDRVIHPSSGQAMGSATAGLFHPKSSSIQVRIHNAVAALDRVPHTTTHALVHEIVHAATSYEMYNHPDGEFAKNIKGLLAEARSQAGPIGLNVHYGLHDEHEFVAEALTNPDFQKFLAEIKSGGEQPRSIFARLADAITKMLGIKDPRARNLLQDTMRTIEQGIDTQSRNLPDSMHTARTSDFLRSMGKEVAARLANQGRAAAPDHMPGLDDALDERHARALEDVAHAMQEEPKPLQHDDEIKSVIGDAATATARLFRRSIKSGTVETIRRNTRGLTPYGGLIRAALRRNVFGHIDDKTNSLRNYDEQVQQRNSVINKLSHSAEPIVNDRAKLSTADNRKLGQFQIDSTMHGIDPEVAKADTPLSIRGAKGFDGRYDDLQRRWNSLTPKQQEIYSRERDWNEKGMRQLRKASVDVALDSYSDKDVPTAQRQLLYSVTDKGDFSKLIGKGKMIDVADRNDKLIESLKDLSSTNELEGPYFHLGRHGDYVVQATPEGTKTFPSQDRAEVFANRVRALSPNSKAKVEMVGGQWQVDYKAEHVSMHNSPAEAEAVIEMLRASGLDVGSATQKILSDRNAALSSGMENIVAGASARLKRRGEDDTTKATIEALRQSFVAQMAARSAYAGSKLARRNIGGVKPEEMGRNFATHAQSLAWNTGHISSVFKVGEALGQLREATKDPNQPQGRALQRGRVYDEITRRTRQETAQAGSSQPANAIIAKAGFANYMTSLSHSIMYLTQNLTTTGFVAGGRFGYRKGIGSLTSAMAMMSGPSFREAYRASVPWVKGHNADSIQTAVMAAVRADKRFGKWAQGENSPLQQLIDRGAIHTSMSNQLATKAKGGNEYVNRVMQYARIMPTMADMFNRVTTGLAALELHNGDVYKAGDFIRETHMDYSNEDKPRAFRALNKIPGGNTITMFKTYVTGMAHLLYSHFHDAAMGDSEGGRAEALKVIAGMMLGTAMFGGVQRAVGIEPLRIMMYAYNRIAHPDRFYSFDNMTRRAVHAMTGDGKVADAINYGLPSLVGMDMSSRMGLSDLMLHDPPDITSLDSQDGWRKLAFSTLGAGADELMTKYIQAQNAMMSGRMDDWAKVVPFKFLNNVYDSWATGTKGKVTGSGAQITAPSAGAAVSHIVGFRTAEEAKISGMQRTDAEYKEFAESRRNMMIGTYQKMDPSEKQSFYLDKIKPWNDENPGHRVTFSDLLRRQKSIQRTERTAQGFLGRDPVQNELNDY